jgi:hypothetical protein
MNIYPLSAPGRVFKSLGFVRKAAAHRRMQSNAASVRPATRAGLFFFRPDPDRIHPGRMTSPASACYLSTMEWIIAIALAVGVFVLVAVFVLRSKQRDDGTVHGWFEFDKYKSGENSKRSLHDKTRWR